MDGFAADHTQRLRRVPQQMRSRDRVERILDAAAEHVVAHGVESLGTRTIADAAGIPVASLYQYFADKDDILLALVERDLAAMAELVQQRVASVERVTVASLVEASLGAFAEAYRQQPAFLMIWLRGRSNPAVDDYCRRHNGRIAEELFTLAVRFGVLRPETDSHYAEITVEIGDRLFQKAFETDLYGDPRILEEARKALTAYLELYATEAGLSGITGNGRPAWSVR